MAEQSHDAVALRSVKMPTFDGTHASFQVWWMRFTAFATVHHFLPAINVNGPETALPVNDAAEITAGDPGRPAREAKRRNAVAYANLSLAMNTEQTIRMLIAGQTAEWPNGLAWKVVQALHQRFKPADVVSKIELRRALNQISMSRKEDPTTLFEQLSKTENTFTTVIPTVDAIAIVMDAAPSEYQAILTAEQRAKGNEITLEDISEAMVQHWRCLYGKRNSKLLVGEDAGPELGMAGIEFKGKCHNCNEYGHKATACPHKKRKYSYDKMKSWNLKRRKCGNCGKLGHEEKDCWNKPENMHKKPKWYNVKGKETGAVAFEAERGNEGSMDELLCMAMQFPAVGKLLEDPCIWIADTGASKHMSRHMQGMTNIRTIGGAIVMGNKSKESINQVADMEGTMCDKEGNQVGEIKLLNVSVSPNIAFNLFSVTKMQLKGWIPGGNAKAFWISKGRHQIKFDIKISTPEGCVFAIYIQRKESEMGGMAISNKIISMQLAHDQLGHMSEKATNDAVEHLGLKVSKEKMKPCAACAAGKAKQKNIKRDQVAVQAPGERRGFLDIATIKKKAGMPMPDKSNWRLIVVDQNIQIKFSMFLPAKSDMVEPTCEQLYKWDKEGLKVTHLRMDNAGENKSLKQRMESKDWKLQIVCEFTARDTPQQNSLAEVGFATLSNRGRALMHRANLTMPERYLLATEALQCATLLDGLVVLTINGVTQTRYEHWNGKIPAFAKHLRTWGEAGTVKVKTSTSPKLHDKGVHCMFVGYATDHSGDTYRMYDPTTNRVRITRDVIWLQRMFRQKPVNTKELTTDALDIEFTEDASQIPVTNPVPAPAEAPMQENVEIQENDDEEVAAGVEDGEGDGEGGHEENNVGDGEDNGGYNAVVTSSGRTVTKPSWLDDYEVGLTDPELRYYAALKEMFGDKE